MSQRTEVWQRERFYQRHQGGESYAAIAEEMGVSAECVRYWCRRQRDGGSCDSRYQRRQPGLLSRFDPKVRYVLLRLRLEHPRWGPNRLLYKLGQRGSLQGLKLPSESQIGRYLHQWPRFRCQKSVQRPAQRPSQPERVHQRWQIDFKMGIALQDEHLVNLHTVRDPVGEVCLGAVVFSAGRVGQTPRKVTAAQVRTTLRHCFARWGTLPEEIQTDGETVLIGQPQGDFPSSFTLWLLGLGIAHLVIRPGRPTDNAEVERCHRTINDYAIVGNEQADVEALQALLETAVDELAYHLPSRAEGCAGRPPIEAHPELLQPPRPFRPEWELASFDLTAVDRHLASCSWQRSVSQVGQVDLGGHRYTVGRACAHQPVLIKFDPTDRHFAFFDPQQPSLELNRRPALGLSVADLTGLLSGPAGLSPQQLPLPWPVTEGVSF